MTYLDYIQIALAIIGAAATIAAITPTKRDDTIVGYITKLVDVFALNVLNAKNKN
jgi:hypothetical protein